MLRVALISCLAFVYQALTDVSADPLPGPIPADLLRVVDGDTLKVRAHIWPGQQVEILVRLAGIDAPEIHRPQCSAERRLADEAKAELETLSNGQVYLHQVRLGKYAGRVIAEAYLPTGQDLAAHLLDIGLAVADGKDDPWCTSEIKDTANAPAP